MESEISVGFVSPGGAVAAVGPAAASGGVSFHDVLSAMNPLQYVPVVGSIYRAVTGDAPPGPVCAIGSVIFSGLTGGPNSYSCTANTAGDTITCPTASPQLTADKLSSLTVVAAQ